MPEFNVIYDGTEYGGILENTLILDGITWKQYEYKIDGPKYKLLKNKYTIVQIADKLFVTDSIQPTNSTLFNKFISLIKLTLKVNNQSKDFEEYIEFGNNITFKLEIANKDTNTNTIPFIYQVKLPNTNQFINIKTTKESSILYETNTNSGSKDGIYEFRINEDTNETIKVKVNYKYDVFDSASTLFA